MLLMTMLIVGVEERLATARTQMTVFYRAWKHIGMFSHSLWFAGKYLVVVRLFLDYFGKSIQL